MRDIALGEEVEINWRSSDGKMVGGVFVYPVGYEEGTRYPLIVAIHGGPASADILLRVPCRPDRELTAPSRPRSVQFPEVVG